MRGESFGSPCFGGSQMGGGGGALLLLAFLSVCAVFVGVSGQGGGIAVSVGPNMVAPVVVPVQVYVAPAPVAAMAPTLAPAPGPAYIFPSCDGVAVTYALAGTTRIFPNASIAAKQPYSFGASVTLENQGYMTLESWGVGLTYQHNEVRFLEPKKSETMSLFLSALTGV